MPLNEHIEGGHGEREPGVKIHPDPVHDSLEMADDGQHRERRLDEHAVFPLAARTQFEVARIALSGMESRITQDNHPFFKLANHPLKRVLRDVGSSTRPRHDQPPLIEQQTEFPTDNPAVVREAFATNLLGAPAPYASS